MGGFATDKVSNVVSYLRDPNTDLNADFRKVLGQNLYRRRIAD